jgi:hypothetical protein
MSDEACRVMTNQKKTTDLFRDVDDIVVPEAMNSQDIETAIRKGSKCVIGIKDDMPGTLRSLSFWFPWTKSFTKELPPRINFNRHEGIIPETRYTLRPDIYEAILNENECDMKLYNTMYYQFQQQIKHMDNHDRLLKESAYVGRKSEL